MRKLYFGLFISTIIIVGCSAEQIGSIDRAVEDVNTIIAGGRAVLDSPAGGLLPPDWRLYAGVALVVVSGAVNIWQKIKGNLMKKTLTTIVKGIEVVEATVKTNPENPVKAAIKVEMESARILDAANKLVDQIKLNL